MTRRIDPDDLRLDVEAAPVLRPNDPRLAALRGEQRIAAAAKFAVQAIFCTAAAIRAEARPNALDPAAWRDLAGRNAAAVGQFGRAQ